MVSLNKPLMRVVSAVLSLALCDSLLDSKKPSLEQGIYDRVCARTGAKDQSIVCMSAASKVGAWISALYKIDYHYININSSLAPVLPNLFDGTKLSKCGYFFNPCKSVTSHCGPVGHRLRDFSSFRICSLFITTRPSFSTLVFVFRNQEDANL